MKVLMILALFSFSVNSAECTKEWMGPLESEKLDETSGIAFSKIHSNILYAHNDSGDKPRIFAMTHEGKKMGKFTIKDAKHVDWEDITVMSCPGKAESSCIAIGDIGNNRYNRDSLTIYIVEEPKILGGKKQTLPLYKKIEFKLDTPQQNFESLFSFGEDLYLVSKMDGNAGQRYPGEEGKSIIYKMDMNTSTAKTIARLDLLSSKEFYRLNEQGESVLKVANYYSWATGADLSADGKTLYLLTYGTVFKFNLGTAGMNAPRFDNYSLVKAPNQPQVEAVAVNSSGVFMVSEYEHQPIYRINCK